MSADFVYLASGSPRRRELLAQIGVPFRILGTSVDEAAAPGEAGRSYVLRVAAAKAVCGRAAVAEAMAADAVVTEAAPVLAADTVVVLDGKVLLKPRDASEGIGMLLALSGRTHDVLTAVAFALPDRVELRLSRTEVRFRSIAPEEARAYWNTGEPCDKAGGYAIQGRAAVFVAHLNGSYTGVMGLPLHETSVLLDMAGVPRWR